MNQELRQQSVRAVTGTAYHYEGDWHALFDLAGVASGTFNDRLRAWINTQLGTSYQFLPDAMQAYAVSQGFTSWNELGTFSPAVFYLDAITNPAIPSSLTFSGANGTYFDSAGVLQDAVSNTARRDHNPSTLVPRGILIEPERTNSIRNNTMAGGGVGVMPTNWNTTTGTGAITIACTGVGIENGIAYADIRFSGTPSATSSAGMRFETATQIVASVGQTWAHSFYARVVGGSMTNIASVLINSQSLDAAGTTIYDNNSTSITTSLTSAIVLTRFSQVTTLANASAERVRPQMIVSYTNGLAIDVTIRIGLPQLELGSYIASVIKTFGAAVTRSSDLPTATLGTFSRASSKSWFNSSGVLTDYAADTRVYDYDPATNYSRGLLVESARTNGIRNSIAQGGGAGVLPTNWNVAGGAGMTVTYIGTGTEDGIPYFDVRFQGTPGATSSWGLRLELAGFIAATLGQTWTQSAFVRMIAGSKANLAALNLAMQVLDAGAVIIESSNATLISVVDGSKLSVCRASGSYTIANASAVSIRSQITISYTNALPVDITLRVGLPQLEQGSGATSPIKTSSAAVTRAADVTSFSGAPFYSVLEVELEAAVAGALASINGADASDAASLISVGSGPVWATSTKTNNTEQAALAPSGTPATGTTYRITHAVASNNVRACVNGGTIVQDTSATIPVPASLEFGADGSGANFSAFWLRRHRLFYGTPADAQMQAF